MSGDVMMKKAKCKNKKMKIVSVIVVSTLIILGYFITIFVHPTFLMYSAANTSLCSGNVTDVYMEAKYDTGHKTRQSTMVYIELDGGDTFYIPNLTLRKNDINYEALKETILNHTVEINVSETKADKIVSIKCNQQDIFTYDAVNKIQLSNRIGLGFVCFIIIAVFSLLKLL